MARTRTKDTDLPPNVYMRHGGYYHVVAGKWHNLGRDRTKAIQKARKRIGTTAEPITGDGHCFLYVIAAEGCAKIGIAVNVSKRMKALQIGHPSKLTLRGCFAVPAARAKTLERNAHRAFAAYRLNGEWFAVSFAEKEHWTTLLEAIF